MCLSTTKTYQSKRISERWKHLIVFDITLHGEIRRRVPAPERDPVLSATPLTATVFNPTTPETVEQNWSVSCAKS
jgi:hypothetical protein